MYQVKEFFEYIFNAVKIWIIIQPWQQGLRVRNGKDVKLLNGGIYFKLPYFDSVYVQETRLRVVS
jgi:regulator of protease activity HflC (stomatin/prohibitin superfamily)